MIYSASSYPVKVSPLTQGLVVDIPQEEGNKKHCLYEWKHGQTGETYIGKTDQTFAQRTQQHLREASSKVHRLFYRRLAADPEFFSVRILLISDDPRTLATIEKVAISNIPKEKCLNSQSGGGGGTARARNDENIPLTPSKKRKWNVVETPVKYYPFTRSSKGSIRAVLTPTAANAENAIYVIKQKSTAKRYVGATGQTVQKRIAQHCFKASHPEKTGGKLYQPLADHPEDFEMGLLASSVESSFLARLEEEYIEDKKAYPHGFNSNAGGGGPAAIPKI